LCPASLEVDPNHLDHKVSVFIFQAVIAMAFASSTRTIEQSWHLMLKARETEEIKRKTIPAPVLQLQTENVIYAFHSPHQLHQLQFFILQISSILGADEAVSPCGMVLAAHFDRSA
jgi:hypothetical protein